MNNFDKLGRIADGYGGSGFPEHLQGNVNGEIPFIKVSDFNLPENNKYIVKANNYVSKKLADNNNFRVFPKNTIVIAKVGAAVYLNRKRILKQDTIIDNNMMGIIPKIDIEFLYQLLLNLDFTEKVQQGALPSLTFNLLSDIDLFVPDLPTQKRIAKILSTVDGQIEKTDAIIAKYQAIKQGMLHDLFTRGIDLSTGKLRPTPEQSPELYKPSPLGLIPNNWVDIILGSICKFQQGVQVDISLQKNNIEPNYIKFLRIENYTQNSDDFRYIPIDISQNKEITRDEIAIVRYGATAGFVAMGHDGILANNLFKLLPNHQLIANKFLYYYLTSEEVFNFFQSEMSGGAMPALNFGIVEKLKLNLPSLKEQVEIATILSSIEKQIKTEQKNHGKLQNLKQSLMSKLLNGGL